MIPIRKIVLLATVIVVISCIPLYLHLTTSGSEFSRYNSQWNGTSLLFQDLEGRGAVMISDTPGILAYPGSRFLILAPDRTFTAGDLGALRAYLAAGNTVILADDLGTGNQMLEGIGAEIRLLPGNLSSLDFYLWDLQSGRYYPSSVIGYTTHEDPLTAGVGPLLLNRPGGVEGGEVLVETSLMSWMDRNNDRRINANESFGTYSIMAREQVGEGTLYVFSDPSIFINGMVQLQEARNNTLFVEHMLDAPVLLVDQSHSQTGVEEGLIPLLRLVRSTKIMEILVVGMISILIAYLFHRRIL